MPENAEVTLDPRVLCLRSRVPGCRLDTLDSLSPSASQPKGGLVHCFKVALHKSGRGMLNPPYTRSHQHRRAGVGC